MSSNDDDINDAVRAFFKKHSPEYENEVNRSRQETEAASLKKLGDLPSTKKLTEIHETMKDFIIKITEWNKQNRILTVVLIIMAAMQTFGVFTEPKMARDIFSSHFPSYKNSCATDPWAHAYTHLSCHDHISWSSMLTLTPDRK